MKRLLHPSKKIANAKKLSIIKKQFTCKKGLYYE